MKLARQFRVGDPPKNIFLGLKSETVLGPLHSSVLAKVRYQKGGPSLACLEFVLSSPDLLMVEPSV